MPESRPETSAREHLTTGLSYQHDESSPPFCHAKENTSKLSTHKQHTGTLNCSVFFSFHLVSISVRDRIANGVLFLHPHSDSIRQRAFLFKLHTHSLSLSHSHTHDYPTVGKGDPGPYQFSVQLLESTRGERMIRVRVHRCISDKWNEIDRLQGSAAAQHLGRMVKVGVGQGRV